MFLKNKPRVYQLPILKSLIKNSKNFCFKKLFKVSNARLCFYKICFFIKNKNSKVSVKRLFFSTRQQLKKAAIMDSAFIKQTLKNYYLKTNVFGLLQPSSGFYNFSNIN